MRVQKKPFCSFLPCTAHSPRECGVWSSFSDPSLPEGATWVTACSHCLHSLGVFTIVFKWLLVSLQSPGPLLAGAQFRSKYCLWKCPVLGCWSWCQHRLRVMWLLRFWIREQNCHPSSVGLPLSLWLQLTTNAVQGKAWLLPYPEVQAATLLCCLEDLKMSKIQQSQNLNPQQGLWRMLL